MAMTPVIYRGQPCFAEPRAKGGWKVYTGPGEGDWSLAHADELQFPERSGELPAVSPRFDAGLDALRAVGTGAAVLLVGIGAAACAVLAVVIGDRW